MSNISQTGWFRGDVIDRGLTKSSGGFEQLELTLQATQKWDEAGQTWTEFNYEDSEAQAYLNLITSKEIANAVNCRQIMRALNWDGMAFSTLNNPDAPLAKQIQWRIGSETYQGVDRMKVQGIAAYDATPGRAVEKLSEADARAIDAKYAAVLKKLGGGPKPKSAPKPPAAPEKPKADPTPTVSPGTTPAGTPITTPATDPEKPKRGRPPKPPVPPTPPKAASMTQAEAWEKFSAPIEEDESLALKYNRVWTEAVRACGGSDEAIGENWSGVYNECVKRLDADQ